MFDKVIQYESITAIQVIVLDDRMWQDSDISGCTQFTCGIVT